MKTDSSLTPPVWNRNFTILTLGSIVSMTGTYLVDFVSGLYVYEQTSSTFLFALFLVLAALPGIILPSLCGPLLDKFSRKKAIYTLDFVSCFVYITYAVIFYTGHMNYTVLAVGNLITGSISSIYAVAYESFYPMLVDKRNMSKSYAVSSTIECIIPYITPVGWIIYRYTGLGPLLMINAVSFFIAAVFETFIRAKEEYVITENESWGFSQYKKTFNEGWQFLLSEKGLLAIVLYFTVLSFTSSVIDVNMLPYFKDSFKDGELMFQLVWACFGIGRIAGGRLNYKYRIKAKHKFSITMIIYITDTIIDAVLLYFGMKVIFILRFMTGIMSMTSYNIRLSATQSYISDDKKGRFNGAFAMFTAAGTIAGRLITGAACEIFDIRLTILIFMILNLISIFVIFTPYREDVKKILNREY